MKTTELYKYEISGYYLATDVKGKTERVHFSEEVWAKDNVEAMKIVVGNLAWNESDDGRTFLLDVIHYE